MRNGERMGDDARYDRLLRRAFENSSISDLVAPYEAMGYGDMTPIPHEIISEMPNGRILLNNNCVEYLKMMLEVTQLKRAEVPFVLIGETAGDTNKVLFDDFYTIGSESASKLEDAQCDVQMVINKHEELVPNFKERIREMQRKGDGSRAIICFGHTHPRLGFYYGTYSMGDYKNVIQFDDSIKWVRRAVGDDRAQTLGCMVAANGDIDFMFYDRNVINFYKFTDVRGMNSRNEEEILQSYTFNTPY